MSNNYKELQKIKNTELINKGFFNGDKGNVLLGKKFTPIYLKIMKIIFILL